MKCVQNQQDDKLMNHPHSLESESHFEKDHLLIPLYILQKIKGLGIGIKALPLNLEKNFLLDYFLTIDILAF